MILSISQLKNKWKKEKKYYKSQEVGSGVQKFIKDILKCPDIFDLGEGKLSTHLQKRKNEFLEEYKTEGKRKADIAIFISPEIIVPLEVEQYTHIERGEIQLFNYQEDLEKKYGILTDGFDWRFYNNNIYRKFNLNQILEETSTFIEFWKEYIKPEYYYLSFFEEIGQIELFEVKVYVEDYKQIFFRDITNLIKSFKEKLKIEGYFQGLERKEREKKATEITYAYIIQFILYKALVDNEFYNFGDDYEKRVKRIHLALKKESFKDILGVIDGISTIISKNIYRPFIKEQEQIRCKLLQLYQSIKNELSDVSPWLDIFVFIKKFNFQNIQNEIFGYIYENYLKELFEEKQKGQYFTDPVVVNFMLKQVGYTSKTIMEKVNSGEIDKISIVDPACGSGTFLYSATDEIIKSFGTIEKETSIQVEKLVNNNIFGADIAEFPLYLAEMNILMRMLPLIVTEKYNNPVDKKIKVFWTEDSIAEFINLNLDNTDVDLTTKGGQRSFPNHLIRPELSSYVRDEDDLSEMKDSMTKFPRRRFDFCIGNPPYVGYNKCSKQDLKFVKLIQSGKVKMNNIFGVNLNTVPGFYKAYAPKPNLYAFFIALGIALLKDNGRLCFIIPQTILTSTDLDVLRYHLSKFLTIKKIITFNNRLFIERGLKQKKEIATSSLIFLLDKKLPKKNHSVEIINYKSDRDSIEMTMRNILSRKKIEKKRILQSELYNNLLNWNFIRHPKILNNLYKEYQTNSENIDIYRFAESSIELFNGIFYFDKGLVFKKEDVLRLENLKKDEDYYLPKFDKNKYQIETSDKIIKKSSLRFPKGSQGMDVYDLDYKIIWRYMNYDKFYFCDKKMMINHNYVIISSDSRKEILYLLSLLNSSVVKFLLNYLFRSEKEKDILVGIKSIKYYFRVPKLNKENLNIKNEIIDRTNDLLLIEEKKLFEFVDFSKVMLQKFNEVTVEGDYLFLKYNNKQIRLKIKNNSDLVYKEIKRQIEGETLRLNNQEINLSKLKYLPIIDFDKQTKLNKYINDLIFSLYFKVPVKKVGIKEADEIKIVCRKNQYYKFI